MNFNKYFAIFVIVVLCLLGQQAAKAHSIFGNLKKDVESGAHKVGAKLDNVGDKVVSDVHETGGKLVNMAIKWKVMFMILVPSWLILVKKWQTKLKKWDLN
ncbi:uncharacterized protein LOC119614095 [Lucilia sericata]|uniref:uncharacterized protein LOC119614095 n=1 Tax=Lucilia sericata TaxID=13632 RepID=UPI0018A879EF|nr:uncharacterized protein LOC119614095 [Lucilia sericata]